MNKIRCRFGVRLSWPITNAGTFVIHIPLKDFEKFTGAVQTLQGYLEAAGRKDIGDRLFFEAAFT